MQNIELGLCSLVIIEFLKNPCCALWFASRAVEPTAHGFYIVAV